jgi:hypothetical protein
LCSLTYVCIDVCGVFFNKIMLGKTSCTAEKETTYVLHILLLQMYTYVFWCQMLQLILTFLDSTRWKK